MFAAFGGTAGRASAHGFRLAGKAGAEGADGTFLLIEGAGGIYVPLNDRETMLDFMREIDFPVLLVVGNKLGCINHALLSLDVQRTACACAG